MNNEIEGGVKALITIFDRGRNRDECKGAYFPAFREKVKYVEYAPAYMILASSPSLPLGMLAKTFDRNFPGRYRNPYITLHLS